MTIIRATFERSNALYTHLFYDWLHINFIIRTLLFVLLLWLLVYIAAQVFRYIMGPLALMLYYHIILRFWNFLFVETPQEWIYVRYYSKELPKYQETYLRLCDKSDNNRQKIQFAKYKGMVLRTRKPTLRLMIMCGVVATLWAASFGLHQQYYVPVTIAYAPSQPGSNNQTSSNDNAHTNENHAAYNPSDTPSYPPSHSQNTLPYSENSPGTWSRSQNITLALNDIGQQGARVRNGPGISQYNVIEILWDNAQMVYLHSFSPDQYVEGLYWLFVLTPSGVEGYVSSQLITPIHADTN